jgi:tetratricopeptide (TPR) repeat protein
MAKQENEATTEAPATDAKPKAAKKSKDDKGAGASEADREKAMLDARARVAGTGRNDACHCGSGKKYKKCHLVADEAAAAAPPEAPDAQKTLANAWGLFEQRRPGAAEREFRAALALDPNLVDAKVGIGMARLSANDVDAAKVELSAVVADAEKEFAKLRAENVTDAFTRPTVQPIIRAAHALGCLAYDQERFTDAYADLERVFAIDTGAVGTEARLIAAKALMKQDKAADAVKVLEPAAKSETGASRAHMGLALAQFVAGSKADAQASLTTALEANPHFAKAVLGRIRRRVENLAGSQPGSIEEALVYAQTYGDVWTDDAKKLLIDSVDGAATAAAAPTKSAAEKASTPSAG